MKTVQITPPTWETAIHIYIDVLQNPDASPTAHDMARAELIRLARMFDDINKGDTA